jgi:malic enzyme
MKDKALRYHSEVPGKIGTSILTRVEGKDDLSLAYSPGVAFPCLEIAEDSDKVYDYTAKGNLVAVVSNGTAVLGLGNIGVLASKPVMEGKALLFKHFAGIDAVDVEVDSLDVDEFVRVVELISPSYGGINLEDIRAPECFEIERILKEKLSIPVFHDDQHGTAIVVGAGLLSALRRVGKSFDSVKVVVNGAGAAGIAIIKMLINLGVDRDNLYVCDRRGLIFTVGSRKSEVGNIPCKSEESSTRSSSHGSLEDVDESKLEFAREMSKEEVNGREEIGLGEVVDGADVFIGVSAADVLSIEMLRSMNEKPIVFALANPNPEIGWDVAHSVRDDLIMATGRSDFPNQVNNVLAFPGIFRGALDCRAGEISEEMKVAAVEALAGLVEGEDIIPSAFDERVVVEVAVAVAGAAKVEGFDLGEYRERLEGEFLGKTDDLVGKKFRHYKGGEYEVVGVCFDADDCRKRVVYRALYDSAAIGSTSSNTNVPSEDPRRAGNDFGKNAIWVRDWDEFFGDVESGNRFEEI